MAVDGLLRGLLLLFFPIHLTNGTTESVLLGPRSRAVESFRTGTNVSWKCSNPRLICDILGFEDSCYGIFEIQKETDAFPYCEAASYFTMGRFQLAEQMPFFWNQEQWYPVWYQR